MVIYVLTESCKCAPIAIFNSPKKPTEFLPWDVKELYYLKQDFPKNKTIVGSWHSEMNGCFYTLMAYVLIK